MIEISIYQQYHITKVQKFKNNLQEFSRRPSKYFSECPNVVSDEIFPYIVLATASFFHKAIRVIQRQETSKIQHNYINSQHVVTACCSLTFLCIIVYY